MIELANYYFTIKELMDLWTDYQWFLTSYEKKQPDIIFLLMEAHSNSDEVVWLKKKKKKSTQMRLGFYQFVGKKGDKNTLERHFEDTNGWSQRNSIRQITFFIQQ